MKPASGSGLFLFLRVLSVVLVAGLLALLVWKIVHQDKGVATQLAKGKRPAAPHFALDRLDRAGKLSLASLRGKVVVLNFWASWCAPCKGEAPRLEAAWRNFRRDGVVVVGVDAQDFSGDARRFIRRFALTYPNVHDGPGDILPKYGVTGFPETYFVGRDGRLVGERVQGEISEQKLIAGIKRALSS
jgi:cytochrome c biogenesis protein CcmG/thiol:disulfide interchange protein DsbE